MKNKFGLIITLLLIVVLTSCDSKKYFEAYQSIPNRIWEKDNVLNFNISSIDSQQKYNCFVEVRNTENYKYSNLYLFMDTQAPSGKLKRDTLECMLADIRGKWYGKKSGDIVDNKIWFKKDFQFTEIGEYSFRFQQAMREDSLLEVVDFGFRLETIE